MVLTLTLYVPDDHWQIRLADSEPSVAILPGEIMQCGEFFMNPLRGIAFKELSDLAG
jgi:hypothetical protein